MENSEDGTMVTVIKLSSLLSPVYPEVVGKFDIGNLSMGVTYEIIWVIMLEKTELSKKKYSTWFTDEGDRATVVHTKLNGTDMHAEKIYSKRINEWIHVRGGLYETHTPGNGQRG